MKCPLLHRLLWLVALTGLLEGVQVRAAEPVAISLYDKDPNHLWNRLYSALMARAPEADAAVNDLLDPPFWSDTRHLLDDATNQRAAALLGEFVNGQPRPDSMSALQRAVMQRDLLAVFQWLTRRDREEKGALPAPQRELAAALVHAIRAVALTAEEIRKLPDNYAAAVAAPDTVTAFDAAHPGPFLPKDLLWRMMAHGSLSSPGPVKPWRPRFISKPSTAAPHSRCVCVILRDARRAKLI